jgi:hypothetical protein
MTDPADRFLEERLHALARGARIPLVPAEEDVRRGRRRLLRMRVAMAGATTATVAVVLGITGLTAGDPKASQPPITETPTTLPATPNTSPSADSTDTASTDRPDGGQSGGTQVVDNPPPANPGSQHTDDTENPAKNAPTGAATGGTATHGGVVSGPQNHPGGTHSPDPSQTPSATVTPTTTPTDPSTSTPTETPTATPTATPTVPPTQTTRVRVHKVLRYYDDVLAEHLDPDRLHLQPYDRKLDPKEARTLDGRFLALGSTYRWKDGPSIADLAVTVASGWDMVQWECGATYDDWDCRSVFTGASGTAEVAEHDGLRAVAVEHADGQVVVVEADVDEEGLGEAELVAGAADARLVLPGDAPVAPPALDSATFAAYGKAALVHDGETFTQTSLDRSPAVRGTWAVDGTERGTLSWSADPIYSGGSWVCLKTYRSCTDVDVDVDGTSRTVHLARLKKGLGGGWLVQYDGPSYAVRVTSTDPTFPKKRAYLFVNDPDWQTFR